MIYICGDSFSVTDRNAGYTWVDLIQQKLPGHQIVNLASPGASNYLIYLQVKHAINSQCKHIIYQSTSSIRHEFAFRDDYAKKDSYTRYHNPMVVNKDCSVACGSWHNLDKHHSAVLTKDDTDAIADVSMRFFDLTGAIEKNYIYIMHTLNIISNANLKSWAWNRGGFEHVNFKNSSIWDFSKFEQNEVDINLWDYYNNLLDTPVYHITDSTVHQTVCDRYITMLKLHNDSV